MARTVDRENLVWEAVRSRLAECGLAVGNLVVRYVDLEQEDPTGFRCTCCDDLTFDVLVKISAAFGTRNINLSDDRGTDSDPRRYREIVVGDVRWSREEVGGPGWSKLRPCRCGSDPVRCSGVLDGVAVAMIVCRSPENHDLSEKFATFSMSLRVDEAEEQAERFWETLNAPARLPVGLPDPNYN